MVLEPLTKEQLKTIFDKPALTVIKHFIGKAADCQPPILPNQSSLPIQVPKEHIEQWIVQALGIVPVGAGSYPVDVIKENEWGADVKMLSCKIKEDGSLQNGDSGETSLAQKFISTGDTLDKLFLDKDFDAIIKGWSEILSAKINRVIEEKKLKHIYYFFILRAGLAFYLCGLEVFTEYIKNITVLNGSKNSVWAENFIQKEYGSVKVYKAKKRMELRLRPKYWLEKDKLIPFDAIVLPKPMNMREKVINNE